MILRQSFLIYIVQRPGQNDKLFDDLGCREGELYQCLTTGTFNGKWGDHQFLSLSRWPIYFSLIILCSHDSLSRELKNRYFTFIYLLGWIVY
ncbi:unnamed protein product [Rhizophagus irregularis]|nr:unnamed protein product [Rhizophagus irregularis]